MVSNVARPSCVVDGVADRGFCIGCGVCAAVCPASCLTMAAQQTGDLLVTRTGECTACGICLEVCPFADQEVDVGAMAEDLFAGQEGIKCLEVLGYTFACRVGHVTDAARRLASASGGLTTETLVYLMEQGLVDAVALVRTDVRDGVCARFTVARTPDEIRQGGGSAYCPVEISGVLQHILGSDQRWAVVGLPCLVYALRLAQKRIPKLSERLRYVFGLACVSLPNYCYTEYLLSLTGVRREEVARVRYRVKHETGSSTDFYFSALRSDGASGKEVPFAGTPRRLWAEGCFGSTPCNFCEDVFAETADAVFMDAWLPRYMGDPRGTSVVVARSRHMADVFEEMTAAGRVKLEPIGYDKVVLGQTGAVDRKRRQMPMRLAWADGCGAWYPRRRSSPARGRIRDRLRWCFRRRFAAVSKPLWAGVGRRFGPRAFLVAIAPWRLGVFGLALIGGLKRMASRFLRAFSR